MFSKIAPVEDRACAWRQNSRYFGVWFERRKVDKKQTYMKTETCQLYSKVFWIFLPNVIKIDFFLN